MKISEELNLKKQNLAKLNQELDSLFTKSAIRILKIKGFTYTISVAEGALLLFALNDIEIFSNALINAMYALTIVGIPLLAFGSLFKNKKILEENKVRIAEIVDVYEPELKKEITSLQESLSLKKEICTDVPKIKRDNISYGNTDTLENNMASRSLKEQETILKLTRTINKDSKN